MTGRMSTAESYWEAACHYAHAANEFAAAGAKDSATFWRQVSDGYAAIAEAAEAAEAELEQSDGGPP